MRTTSRDVKPQMSRFIDPVINNWICFCWIQVRHWKTNFCRTDTNLVFFSWSLISLPFISSKHTFLCIVRLSERFKIQDSFNSYLYAFLSYILSAHLCLPNVSFHLRSKYFWLYSFSSKSCSKTLVLYSTSLCNL